MASGNAFCFFRISMKSMVWLALIASYMLAEFASAGFIDEHISFDFDHGTIWVSSQKPDSGYAPDKPVSLSDLNWFSGFGSKVSSPVLDSGVLYVCSQAGLHAMDLDRGKEKWIFSAPVNSTNSYRLHPPIVIAGSAYFTSSWGVHAVDTATAQERWRFSPEKQARIYSPIWHVNGMILIVMGQGIYAIDLVTGRELWRFLSRKEKWAAGPDLSRYARTMVIDKDRLYVIDTDNNLLVMDINNGEFLSSHYLGKNTDGYLSRPLIQDDVLYLQYSYRSLMPNMNFAALKLTDADVNLDQPEWSLRLEEAIPNSGSAYNQPVIDGDVIYHNYAGFLYAIEKTSGQILWQKMIGNIQGSPVISRGILYVENRETSLAFDAKTGSPIWVYNGKVAESLTVYKGAYYFSSSDTVYKVSP